MRPAGTSISASARVHSRRRTWRYSAGVQPCPRPNHRGSRGVPSVRITTAPSPRSSQSDAPMHSSSACAATTRTGPERVTPEIHPVRSLIGSMDAILRVAFVWTEERAGTVTPPGPCLPQAAAAGSSTKDSAEFTDDFSRIAAPRPRRPAGPPQILPCCSTSHLRSTESLCLRISIPGDLCNPLPARISKPISSITSVS